MSWAIDANRFILYVSTLLKEEGFTVKYRFHFQFMHPLSSFSVGYKSESNDANDSKEEDLSQLFGI